MSTSIYSMLGYCNCLCSHPAPNPTEQPTRSRSNFPRAVYPSSRQNIFSERATLDSCPFCHRPRPPLTAQKGSMGRLRGLPARLARSTDVSVHQNPWPRTEESVPPRKAASLPANLTGVVAGFGGATVDSAHRLSLPQQPQRLQAQRKM